jgi:hypothetical protein
VWDASAGGTSLVSKPPTGAANGSSYDPSISASGLKVAFTSDADNLMNVDIDAFSNVYVLDRRFNFLAHLSRTTISGISSQPADGASSQPANSADGRNVAFVSRATNLAAGVSGTQAYVRDTQANSTTLVSRAPGQTGAPADANASAPTLSAEGRVVSFVSAATNLSDEDGEGADLFLRSGVLVLGNTLSYDRTTLGSRGAGTASVPADGELLDGAISADASGVAFLSTATNLGIDNPGGVAHVYEREFLFPNTPAPPPDLRLRTWDLGPITTPTTSERFIARLLGPRSSTIAGSFRRPKPLSLGHISKSAG